jgi:hypothetical protein
MNALAFFGLFFLVLAAIALHGWAANSPDADDHATRRPVGAGRAYGDVPRRDARASRSRRPAAFRHVPSGDRSVVADAPATPPVLAVRASETTTSTK